MNIGQQVEEQWGRVKRYYERLEKLCRSGRIHDANSNEYVDDIYSFFIHCYHLKDWIREDTTSRLRSAVKDFGRDSESFQICRDLCNGVKHLKIRTPGSDLADPRLGRKEVAFNVSTGVLSMKVFVQTEDGEKEAFAVATECMTEWEEFLSR